MTSSPNKMKKCCNLMTCVVKGKWLFCRKCSERKRAELPRLRQSHSSDSSNTHISLRRGNVLTRAPRIHSHAVCEVLLAKVMLKMTSEMWNPFSNTRLEDYWHEKKKPRSGNFHTSGFTLCVHKVQMRLVGSRTVRNFESKFLKQTSEVFQSQKWNRSNEL